MYQAVIGYDELIQAARSPWQITVSIWTQTAAHYLRYLDMTNGEAETYRAAYKIGDIKTWANEKIQQAIAKANALVTEHTTTGQPIIAHGVEPCSVERLRGMGLNIGVSVAASCKTDTPPAPMPADMAEAAWAYLSADRAWWRSLMAPPYNAAKPAPHWHLRDAATAAWARYTGLLREHGMEPPDRRGYAKTLAIMEVKA